VEHERAIVTATPGTTRDLVTETVALGGIPVRLVDTAGIRATVDEAETIGVRKSMEALADADLVLLVVDASQPSSPEDDRLSAQLEGRVAMVVENKIDLPQSSALASTDEGDSNLRPRTQARVRTSALTGAGMERLRAQILDQLGAEPGRQESGFLTNVRHQGLVRDCLGALDAAAVAVAQRLPHEMLLLDLHNALQPLDEITGATTADDILNLIFSRFCIGK
jgi:tRNA modification GTPase